MKKLLLCTATLVLFVGSALSATITGRVIAAEDNQPLARATVVIVETGKTVPTDEEGYFHLEDVDSPVIVTVSHVGYSGQSEVTLENDKDNLIKLQRSLTVLDSYVVNSQSLRKGSLQSIAADHGHLIRGDRDQRSHDSLRCHPKFSRAGHERRRTVSGPAGDSRSLWYKGVGAC